MICKDCRHFKYINNTDKTAQGVCTFPINYVPVNIEAKCAFEPDPYTCGDCVHLSNGDFACMTQHPDDSAYREDGHLCPGFMSLTDESVFQALFEWKMRGYNIDEKLKEIVTEFNEDTELPF